MIRVLVNGALGRMGRAVCRAVKADPELELVGTVDIFDGEVEGLTVEKNLVAALKNSAPDVMIDFTHPAAVFQNVMTALTNKVSPVVGTTGLSDDALDKIRAAADQNHTPAFIAPNFALGAVLLMLAAQKIARYMPEVEIIERHHDKKLDAPSGTAELTAKMIAEVRPSHKQGHPDEQERLAHVRGADFDGIRIHSVRLPGYVAHQEVIFGGLGQTLTIRHDSTGRDSFMPGVVLACKKVRNLRGLTVGLDKILD